MICFSFATIERQTMIIFTLAKKFLKTFLLFRKIAFIMFLSISSSLLRAHHVNAAITDFGGYCRSDSAALNPVYPNTSHNVVAFKVGTTIYSTGTNNTLLNSKGLAYTVGNFKALPITSITGTVAGPPLYIALAPNYDGVSAGFSNPPLMVRGSRSVSLNNNEALPSSTIITTGSLSVGTVNVSSSLLSTKVGNYSFVGSPYACPVNWRTVKKSGVSNSYFAWDERLNTKGAFVACNGLTETNSSSASAVDHNIQSEQGFFVQCTSASPSITFKESDKSYTNTAVFRTAATMTKMRVQLLLNLNGGSSSVADEFTAVFDDRFSYAVGDEDAYKFPNLDENIAINRDGTTLSIEGRPRIKEADTINIRMWQFRQKSYWLKVDAADFSTGVIGVLKDQYLQQQSPLDLSSSTAIPFSITSDPASSAPDRFLIVFESYATLPVSLKNVKAVAKEKGIQVEWQTENETNIATYEVERSLNGREFEQMTIVDAKSDNATSHSYNFFDAAAFNGDNFYRIKLVEKNGAVKFSSVIRTNFSRSKSNFTVFPNPVKNNQLHLQMPGMAAGRYAISMYNSWGQKVYSGTIDHDGTSLSQTVSLTQKTAKGNYILQLSGETINLVRVVLMR